jgi:serine/threonine protein kinase
MFRSGQQIGTYTLIKRIGRGGFGEVWLAERRAKFVTTKVAVKLPLDEQVNHEAIKSEAVLWEQANGHPNVLPIIDADEYDGQIVIVSEYAPDGSLDDLLQKEGKLPARSAVELTNGILNGLDFLHNRKIIHRDIKPANILLQGDTPRLADFGISRVMKTTSVSMNMSGTPAYMAPEAFDRKRTMQTDIWSVGVILYQLLKGSLPFPFQDMTELLGAIIINNPEPLPDFVEPRLQEMVFKALAKKSEERYQTAREMRNDLADFLVGILQQNLQQTLKKADLPATVLPEELNETIYADALKQTQLSPTIQSPVPPDTAGITIAETQASTDFLEFPKIESQRPKANSLYIKLLAPFTVLILLAVGGLYLFINKANPTNENGNQPASIKLASAQLIPYLIVDKFGYVDKEGKKVVEPKYDNAGAFSEGLAAVRLNNKLGYIDQTGKEVIELKYKGAFDFIEEVALVNLNDKWGFIDKTGKEVIEPKYTEAPSMFSEGLAVVKIASKYGFIDKTGRLVIEPKYDDASSFSEGLARVKLDDKYSFIDKNGKEVIAMKFFPVTGFHEDLVVVTDGFGFKCGYADKSGKLVIPLKYELGASFSEGLGAVSLNDKSGYIDKTGKVVIPFNFKYTRSFTEGLAGVKIGDKWGYIDKTGKVVIQAKFDEISEFKNGLAQVKYFSFRYYIGKDGSEYYEQ